MWNTSFIDEFHYFLGEPLADLVKNGYIYERSFENLDLCVNSETKETNFNWKDKTPLSVNTYQLNTAIYLYPNIVDSTFGLSQKITSAIVINALGQEILSFSENKNKYNVFHLKKGVFFIKIILENGEKETIRFVKKLKWYF